MTDSRAWASTTVGEVLRLRYGKALPPAERDPEGPVPVVGSAGRMTGTHTPLVAGPAVLIGRKGNVGAVQVEPSGSWPIDTTYYATIPPEFNQRFLRWQLHALNLGRLDSSTTTPSLRRQDLEAQRVVIPPLAQQQRIVDLLEDHLSRLDAAHAYLAAARRRSEAMVMSSMAHAVAAASRTSPMTCVGAEAALMEYGTSAKCGGCAGVSSPVPVLRMGNLKKGEIVWDSLKYLAASHPEFPKLILAPGDLLFNRTNSAELVGKSAVYESGPRASFASYLIRVRFRESVDPRWANIAINSPQGRAYVTSVASQQVGQANVNGTKLKAFPIPLPSVEHQQELIATHDAVHESARGLAASASLSAQRAAALRRALLAAAFSGHLTESVSDLSVAAERIPT